MRRTVRQPVVVEGVGLHLGRQCRLEFRPAPSGAGVSFLRTDLGGTTLLPARAESAVLTHRRTQLGEGDGAVHTVEHVLAAVAGLEIDDLVIALNAAEPPIGDGSAAPFVAALRSAGVVHHRGDVQYLDIMDPVIVTDGDSRYEAYPAERLELDVTIEFPHPLIGTQRGCYTVTEESFARELAPARTFGFVHEVETLRGMGLIQGATTANAVVLDGDGVLDTVLRWPDEFVRHKALDCVGDLALTGRRVRARIVAIKPSHRGTVRFVRALGGAPARR